MPQRNLNTNLCPSRRLRLQGSPLRIGVLWAHVGQCPTEFELGGCLSSCGYRQGDLLSLYATSSRALLRGLASELPHVNSFALSDQETTWFGDAPEQHAEAITMRDITEHNKYKLFKGMGHYIGALVNPENSDHFHHTYQHHIAPYQGDYALPD